MVIAMWIFAIITIPLVALGTIVVCVSQGLTYQVPLYTFQATMLVVAIYYEILRRLDPSFDS